MSDDNRDQATGQFTPAEPAFGREGVEREAGYVPFKGETATEGDGELTLDEAAAELAKDHDEAGTAEGNIRTYSPVDDLADNVSLTEAQAAKMLAEQREA